MNSSPPWIDKPKQRSVIITEEAWTAMLKHSVRVKQSASLVCRKLLTSFLALQQKPQLYEPDQEWTRARRSVYVPDALWEETRLEMIRQKHSVSKLLEQLIRQHLGLDLGKMEKEASEQRRIGDSSG